MRAVRLLLLLLLPASVAAQNVVSKPRPSSSRAYSLLARAAAPFIRYVPNRTSCGVDPNFVGQVNFYDGIEGCSWPYGTANNYVYNSGLQVAGIIGAGGGPWVGDTSGAFFWDAKGTTENGEALTGVFTSDSIKDRAELPAYGRIAGGANSLFLPERWGQVEGSFQDAWSMTWDGNAGNRRGRGHPLGVAVETRVLGWPYPRGNDDIQYVIYTIYNITATDPVVYSGQRPEIRDRLVELGTRFQASVSSTLGVSIPATGYTLSSWFAGYAVDADVGNAGSNFASVNLPFSTIFTYDWQFSRAPGWTFDPRDHLPPFFGGAGFSGATVLVGPTGTDAVQLVSTTINGSPFAGALNDPRDVVQLYRYLSGTLSTAFGDSACNTGIPSVTHVCFINNTSPADVRAFASVQGGQLAPGASATFALALTFAAPYGPVRTAPVSPGNVLRLTDPAALATGANPVDSITGFQGYTDRNGDGAVQAEEFTVATRSLLGKVRLAQALFRSRFLMPSAPIAPDFFLVPGDNSVSVLWKPSISETTGDPYFATASAPTVTSNGQVIPNPLYDPNYRQFDVEGYRVYRSRTPDFRDATLLAQFDYAGTVIRDYTGRVNPRQGCAPEFGVRQACPTLDSLMPGQAATAYLEYDIAGQVIQMREGDRYAAPDGTIYPIIADTVGGDTELTCFCNTGVPFLYVDRTPRNGLTYYYAVSAYDVNSLQSAPSSLASPLEGRFRSVQPFRAASNVVSEGDLAVTLEGRGRILNYQDSVPAVDVEGRFSGPFPPANGWSATPLNFARQLFQGAQEARLRLDSLALGQADLIACCTGGQPQIPTQYYFTLSAGQDVTHLTMAVENPYNNPPRHQGQRLPLYSSDPTLAARYGGAAEPLLLDFQLLYPNSTSAFDWGFAGITAGNISNRLMNGARWFDGPSPTRNETEPNPTRGNCNLVFSSCIFGSFNNAGALAGVTTVYQPHPYMMFNRDWRNMSESMIGAHRAADYNVYWGAGGLIDSVIDVTHNVVVPFSPEAAGTWGILNTSAQGAGGHDGRPGVLTPTDWSCVEPFRSRLTLPTSTIFPCSRPIPFYLSQRAELGQIAFGYGDNQSTTNPQSVRNPANLSPEPGFALYLAGTITQFGLNALPSAGTVWAMRDYVGVISGNPGNASYVGSFQFRPLTAVGVELVVRSDVTNTTVAVQDRDLRQVHTVPDPFYYSAAQIEGQGVKFVNLPTRATIRIYTASGILIRVLDHQPASGAGDEYWDLKTRNGQRVASGVYFYHVESADARRVGRMTIVAYTD